MKILHVAQSLKGGPAAYFDEIIPHQISQYGSQNVVLVIPAEDVQYLSVAARRAEIITFPTRRRSLRSLLDFVRVTFRSLRSVSPDVAHFHSTFAGALGRLLVPWGQRRPVVVYCAHGWAFDMGTSGAKSAAFALVERLLALGTHVIVNISRADQRSAEQHKIGPGKNVMIHNGIGDTAPDPRSKEELQRECGMDPAKLNILFVGRFDRQKGADIALDAAALLPHEQYALYAIGDAVVSTETTDAVPEQATNVHRLGWMDRPAIGRYYQAADVVIMPSRWEGFGLVAAEAMRAGTPVLASTSGALPELVIDGQVGRLVASDKPAAFAAVLQSTGKPQWRAMGLAARPHFLANFTADRLNAALDQVYADYAGAPHRRPSQERP